MDTNDNLLDGMKESSGTVGFMHRVHSIQTEFRGTHCLEEYMLG